MHKPETVLKNDTQKIINMSSKYPLQTNSVETKISNAQENRKYGDRDETFNHKINATK